MWKVQCEGNISGKWMERAFERDATPLCYEEMNNNKTKSTQVF